MFVLNKNVLILSMFLLCTSLTTLHARATGFGMEPREYDDEDNEIFEEEIDKEKDAGNKKLDDTDYYALDGDEEEKKIEDGEKKKTEEDEEEKKMEGDEEEEKEDEEVEEKKIGEDEEEKKIEEDEEEKKIDDEEEEDKKIEEDEEEEKKLEEAEEEKLQEGKFVFKKDMDEEFGKEEGKRPRIRDRLFNFYDKLKGFFKNRFYKKYDYQY